MNKLSLCTLIIAPIIFSPAISDELNLATCLLGEYSDICNHDLLTKEQAKKVEQAELQAKYTANLETCSRQLYSEECESGILSNDDYLKIEQKYVSDSRNNQISNERLEEASRIAHERKNERTKIKYVEYTLDFGRGNHVGTVMGGGRGLGNPNRTLDGRDKRLVTADRNRERAYDKAIRNVRGTSAQSMSVRANLEHEKISGMSSEYNDRDRERAYDKAIRNVRGTSAQSVSVRANLELAKQGLDTRSYRYNEKRSISSSTMAAQAALSKNRERSVGDWDVPSPMLSNRREPSAVIDVTTGTFMPKVAGGYIDPRNGTFHAGVAGGAINTRTGAFSPIIR